MATAREYYDKDTVTPYLRLHNTFTATNRATGEPIEVVGAVSMDFNAGSKFCSLYVSAAEAVGSVGTHFLENIGEILQFADGAYVWSGFADTDEHVPSTGLVFSRRLNIYTPGVVPAEIKGMLNAIATQRELSLVIRDGAYVQARDSLEVPRAFISHDSRDKDAFVRELAKTMSLMRCPVWYDEYTLVPGQSLRATIEEGLKNCKKCVLVLSPNFLSNDGWTKAEFDSVFTREILETSDVILPVWLNVDKRQVYEYSPRLLDKVGVPASLGVDEVARRLVRAIDR